MELMIPISKTSLVNVFNFSHFIIVNMLLGFSIEVAIVCLSHRIQSFFLYAQYPFKR